MFGVQASRDERQKARTFQKRTSGRSFLPKNSWRALVPSSSLWRSRENRARDARQNPARVGTWRSRDWPSFSSRAPAASLEHNSHLHERFHLRTHRRRPRATTAPCRHSLPPRLFGLPRGYSDSSSPACRARASAFATCNADDDPGWYLCEPLEAAEIRQRESVFREQTSKISHAATGASQWCVGYNIGCC